jgi:hypothetical protein
MILKRNVGFFFGKILGFVTQREATCLFHQSMRARVGYVFLLLVWVARRGDALL